MAAGRTLFLHGPSGGGKSTLLGLLAGVLLPRSGSVSLLGQRWSDLSGARRDAFRADHVGYIFQQFNLLPYLSVLDNVLLPCRFSALRHERATLDAGTPAASAHQLLQRVGLAPALWARIVAPEVLIADEPTSALDADMREGFMALLLEACRAAGSTLVFVSHDERLAARFDERLSLATVNRATPADPAENAA